MNLKGRTSQETSCVQCAENNRAIEIGAEASKMAVLLLPVFPSSSRLHYPSTHHTLCAWQAEQLSFVFGRSVSPLHHSHK